MRFHSTAVLLAAATLVATSCTRVVDDARAVADPDRKVAAADESQCEEVDAPLTTIPALGDDEPVLKIPQPPGWDRETGMDSELLRFAMVNMSLADDSFTPNVVVTLETQPGLEDPEVVFEAQRDSLESGLGVTDLEATQHTLCGLPAETVTYETPTLGNVPPHPAIALLIVLHADGETHAVSATAQTLNPDNPDYQRDVETVMSGFQMLPPSAQ